MIAEYLEEAYPDTRLLGRTLAERVEVRRLAAWFDGKFAAEVTAKLLGEKYMKRLMSRGNPDATALRAGYAALGPHLEVHRLAERNAQLARRRRPLAGRFRRRGAAFRARLYRRDRLGQRPGGEGSGTHV